jgi:hypothetical protein
MTDWTRVGPIVHEVLAGVWQEWLDCGDGDDAMARYGARIKAALALARGDTPNSGEKA